MPGAAYWMTEHPEIETPEDLELLCRSVPGYAGRKVCIERMHLEMPQDNPIAVYYEMAIHFHWGKNPDLPAPDSEGFADAAISYANQLPPPPADFVVKDLYLGGEWEEWFEQLE